MAVLRYLNVVIFYFYALEGYVLNDYPEVFMKSDRTWLRYAVMVIHKKKTHFSSDKNPSHNPFCVSEISLFRLEIAHPFHVLPTLVIYQTSKL